MAQRIKGQEVELLLVVNDVAQTTINTVRSFEFAFQNEILKEGYLGETTDRRDSLFRGVRGRMELHLENADIFTFFKAVVDKSRRRTPGTKINVKATLNFPNGQKVRVMIPDVEFGELPVNFGSRSDYGTTSLDFEASEANTIS